MPYKQKISLTLARRRGAFHRAKLCFIFHALKARFIRKTLFCPIGKRVFFRAKERPNGAYNEVKTIKSTPRIHYLPLSVQQERLLRKFCVSEFRQNQEFHVINVHNDGLFPLTTTLPIERDGMRAARGVNAVALYRES